MLRQHLVIDMCIRVQTAAAAVGLGPTDGALQQQRPVVVAPGITDRHADRRVALRAVIAALPQAVAAQVLVVAPVHQRHANAHTLVSFFLIAVLLSAGERHCAVVPWRHRRRVKQLRIGHRCSVKAQRPLRVVLRHQAGGVATQ
ncbi:hypothetical protein PAGU2196_28480 [Pseudomonas sp. PAGU 2196]|nr:hypothetical protein PAGU2196_28480 [Pseudomonas sp. PAGU 2196]